MNYGFVRVAAITPQMKVADVAFNTKIIIDHIRECAQKGVQVAVFPELSLSGATCGDLFLQSTLLSACKTRLQEMVDKTRECKILCFVGLPYLYNGKVYDVAAAFCAGKLLGIIPKRNLPYAQQRYFSPYMEEECTYLETRSEEFVPFGSNILFRAENAEDLVVACELGEDAFSLQSPSETLCSMGAKLIVNLSACSEVVGAKEGRKTALSAQSRKCLCGYVYASCGEFESTGDAVYAGHDLIFENGKLLQESQLFDGEKTVITEIDLQKIAFERAKQPLFSTRESQTEIFFDCETVEVGKLYRRYSKSPFVPEDEKELFARCEFILNMQATALSKRLLHTGAKTVVVGVSGGLDSTLALLATARAFDRIQKDRKEIVAVTMPGFGTTGRTYKNAVSLIERLGATFQEINVTASVLQHFEDIGHDKNTYDVTYENAQARMRTLILMDLANKTGGLVVGTGDLSELALGWCTYSGDQMSMYSLNGSVPKTLIRHIVSRVASQNKELYEVLTDILNTEISPELLPPDASGQIAQKTEDLVGPYALHDFYLYYAVRCGFSPKKIYYIAKQTFAGSYDDATLKKWLKNFYRRFFAQQFKRSCMPDGVKVGTLSLSPRGDFVMPSDALSAVWMEELEECE